MRYVRIQTSWQGRSDCASCELREDAFLGALDAGHRAALTGQLEALRFPRQGVIFHQGARAEAAYMLRQGAVKLVRYQDDGSQRIVRLLRPGDVLGLEAAVPGSVHQSAAFGIGEVFACRLPAAALQQAVRVSPGVGMRLLQTYDQALREAESWLAELSAGAAPARVRVARLLLRLQIPRAEPGVLIKIGAADVGDVLGITVETASRVLAAFKREGLLRDLRPRAGLFGDLARLARIAHESRPPSA